MYCINVLYNVKIKYLLNKVEAPRYPAKCLVHRAQKPLAINLHSDY